MSKILALAVAMAALVAIGADAQTQYIRLADPQVKSLIGQIGQHRDRFQDALDGALKRSILRTETGEVSVDNYLQDLKRNVEQAKDRLTPDYAASNEVLTLLKQCTDINAFVQKQPVTFKGRSEWESLAAALASLATTYGTSFPLPQGASARRLGDKEVVQAADAVAQSAEQFRKAITKAMKTAKADPKLVTSMDTESKAIVTAAKVLKSRVSEQKPATSEARTLLDQANKVRSLLPQPVLGEPSAPWESVLSSLKAISQAFSLPGA
jgi:hypothetical protein